jgi:hypothetical protein
MSSVGPALLSAVCNFQCLYDTLSHGSYFPEPTLFSWSGGTGPYYLTLVPGMWSRVIEYSVIESSSLVRRAVHGRTCKSSFLLRHGAILRHF